MDRVDRDVISIKNLSLPHPVLAPDAWSFTPSALANKAQLKYKAQPATVSLELLLKPQSFANAARDDTVNPAHTVHYGELSKDVRACSRDGQSLMDILQSMTSIVGARPAVSEATTRLYLPKGSMTGQSTLITQKLARLDHGPREGDMIVRSGSLSVTGVPLSCLIGVNADERTGKQPLILDLHVMYAEGRQNDGEDAAIGVLGPMRNRAHRLLTAFTIETYLREVGRCERENEEHALKIEGVIDNHLLIAGIDH
jgi:dihydroneopterin aldolase